MAVIKVPTSFNIDLEFEVPEFFRRIMALAIDMLVQFLYIRIASVLYARIEGSMSWADPNRNYNLAAIGLLIMLPVFLYHVVLEITMNGQSIGKKIMGIRVVNENGGRPSIGQFLIRWLLRVSDLWIIIIFFYFLLWISSTDKSAESTFLIIATLGFLITDIVLVVSSRKNQRIGDILARTILIRTSQRADISDTVFQEVEETYVPLYPQIMQLSDRDINAIKNILETAKRKNDYLMADSAADKIKNHLKIESQQDAIEFLETVMKDYNFLSTQ